VKSETKICVPTEEDCEGKEEGGAGIFFNQKIGKMTSSFEKARKKQASK